MTSSIIGSVRTFNHERTDSELEKLVMHDQNEEFQTPG
jgi:hypothetical protein